MAIKQRCLFWNKPLPWDKRSDAKYCSAPARCRQRAYEALRFRPKLLKVRVIYDPPLDDDSAELVTTDGPGRGQSSVKHVIGSRRPKS